MIDHFDGPYAFLSNFYDSPVSYEGITYRNSEAAYQAQKAADPAFRIRFKDLPAGQAKHLGRAVELRPDWSSVRFKIMREVVHDKFKQSPALALLLADTGAAELIEGNWWHDNTFGDCKCPKCTEIPGQNVLGNILMDERRYWQNELGWPVKEV